VRMTNRRNRITYRLWAPVYDALLARFFRPGRVRAMRLLEARAGQRLLLVGVGTGADLPLLPAGVQAVGIDLSAAMLARAKARLPLPDREISLVEADAQTLRYETAAFDAVVLNLILSVVPDPAACLREALRVLHPGGRAVVFDKFQADGSQPTLGRRVGDLVTTMLGTSITRRLGDILAGQPCSVVSDEPSLLGGMYRVVLLRRD
jgi:phosphatidylethanolamine/phosphatidyl-N-methylethanolamine N-methyltransferase